MKESTVRSLATPHRGTTREERESVMGQRGGVVWLTGLSASGKSTIACHLEYSLFRARCKVYTLDGDCVRSGLNSDLGFSALDRRQSIRRAGEVAAILADAGLLVIAAFISPYREDRARVRALLGHGRFLEVFVDAPLCVCERRDPKGLYAKARAGRIPNFTGISDPYEAPERPELVVRTAEQSPSDCAKSIMNCMVDRGLLGPIPRFGDRLLQMSAATAIPK